MKKILLVINSFFLFLVIISKIYAEDLRDFTVGSSIELISERGYINLKCKNDKEILKWINFKNCQKNSDGYYVILFEYDEIFANWKKTCFCRVNTENSFTLKHTRQYRLY